jgi:hypothetical protein
VSRLNVEPPDFTFKAWIEAVRGGRSFVSNGPLNLEAFEPVSGPNWQAARIFMPNGGFAHTSPQANDSPTTSDPEAAAHLVRAVESTREWIETVGRFTQPKSKQALLDRCREAIVKLGGGA